MATTNSPFPRWKQLIAQGIKDGMADKQKGVLYFALSTVETGQADANTASNPRGVKSSSSFPSPHVRMVVHRGFVNEQRSSSSSTGVESFNPSFGSNACIMTTTDIRAPKAQDILAQSQAKGSPSSTQSRGARGEICWWMEHKQLQFRIAGTLHLIPRKDHPAFSTFDGKRLAPPINSEASSPSTEFDWANERKRIFEKLSPELLASFTRPMPGGAHPQEAQLNDAKGPGEGEVEDAKNEKESPWPMQLPQPGKEENDEQKQLLAEAEKNFALIVVEPETIDVVDLARDRRSLFTRTDDSKGPNSEWTEQRLVP